MRLGIGGMEGGKQYFIMKGMGIADQEARGAELRGERVGMSGGRRMCLKG